MLEEDVVVGIERASFGKEGIGLAGVIEQTRVASLLDESGDAMLKGERGGDAVVRDGGVELFRVVEGGLRLREVIVCEEPGARDVCVARGVGIA